MHAPRIPTDFDFTWHAGKLHIASGDTAAFWFGALLLFGGAWNIIVELRRVFSEEPDIERKRPEAIGAVLALHGSFVLAGIYLIVCGTIGASPFAFLPV